MYKWKIKVILKSGVELFVTIEDNNKMSEDVAKTYFNSSDNTFLGMGSLDGKENVYVKMGEIASYSITPFIEE